MLIIVLEEKVPFIVLGCRGNFNDEELLTKVAPLGGGGTRDKTSTSVPDQLLIPGRGGTGGTAVTSEIKSKHSFKKYLKL